MRMRVLADVEEFLTVSRVFLEEPRLRTAPRVKAVFSGPQFAVNETDGKSGHARNTLFELYVATLLKLAGLPSDLTSDTDVVTVFEGRTVFLECKRPQTPSSAETHIRKAAKQLHHRRATEPDGIGVIVLSLGKLLNDGINYFRIDSPLKMRDSMQQYAQAFYNRTKVYWADKPDVNGLWLQFNLSGINTVSNTPFTVGQGFLFPNTNPALSRESDLIGRLVEKLQNAVQNY